jgi:hypothetical protein
MDPIPLGRRPFHFLAGDGRAQQFLERALTNLAQRVEKGQLKDRSKIERRLGKIQERYVQVADLYEARLSQTEGC